jgi:endo-1,4-beta-xylanase
VLGVALVLCPIACATSLGPGEGADSFGSGGLSTAGGAIASGGRAAGGFGPIGTGGSGGGRDPVGGSGAIQTGGASGGGGTSSGGASADGGRRNSGGASPMGGSTASGGAAAGGAASGSGGWPAEIPRFVGNITTGNSIDSGSLIYSDYWDQITPENAGKWGSVQRTATSEPVWTSVDAIYDYSLKKGIVFKQHAFVWGSQQPSGTIGEADVKAWMKGFCDRYPGTRLIDVVNEPPPHTTPGYVNSIGGGTNGNWQWITNSFKWAREACPNAILILNDFNNIEWSNDNQHFIDIVKTVKQNGGPIDAVGAQAHDLDNGSVSFQTVERLLEKLHNDTGLPVYITELDLSYTDDQQQLNGYKQYFPLFWGKDYVPGITIWGWIYGRTWSQAPNSGLVRDNKSRSAMTWLMGELDRPTP